MVKIDEDSLVTCSEDGIIRIVSIQPNKLLVLVLYLLNYIKCPLLYQYMKCPLFDKMPSVCIHLMHINPRRPRPARQAPGARALSLAARASHCSHAAAAAKSCKIALRNASNRARLQCEMRGAREARARSLAARALHCERGGRRRLTPTFRPPLLSSPCPPLHSSPLPGL